MGFPGGTPARGCLARKRVRRLGLIAVAAVAAALLVPPLALADGHIHVNLPGGPGMVTSTPPGISCPPQCDADFPGVVTVVLTAVDLNGYSLFEWNGCASIDASTTPPRCSVDTDATVDANFHPAAKLDVSPQGPGSVQASVVSPALGEGDSELTDSSSGNGECHDTAGSLGEAHCVLPYLQGRVVTLTATPSSGEPFLGWGRYDCPALSLTCVITMSSDHQSVTPLFGTTATMHVLLGGAGVVTSVPPGLAESGGVPPCIATSNVDESGPQCDLILPMLSPVRLTATPANPFASVQWSPRCEVPIDDPNSCIVTMAGAEWISVSIGGVRPQQSSPPGYDIVFTVSHTGSGTVRGSRVNCGSTCSAIYPFGNHDTLVATADPGFHFATWRGACNTVPTCSLWVGPTTSLLAVFEADATIPVTPPPPPPPPKVRLKARIVQLRQVGHRRARVLVVRLFVDHAADLRATLQRGRGRTSWSFKLRAGTKTLRMHVPRATRAGNSRLVLALTDASGTRLALVLTRSLRLRR
jgi:hypothetical protein